MQTIKESDKEINGNHKKHFEEKFLENLAKTFLQDNREMKIDTCDVKECDNVIGFQGDYYKMCLKVNNYEGTKRQLHFFIKSLPQDEEKAEKLKEAGYFNREYSVYTKIFPKFDEVQSLTEYHAKCASFTNTDIILEDLHMYGYKITKSRETFDRDHCLVSLRSLAKFHAASFILEEKYSTKLKKFRIQDEYKDFLHECGYKYEGWYVTGVNAALAAAIESGKYGHIMKKEKNVAKWKDVFRSALDLCCPSDKYRNVLCHRDLWANNLMFRYDIANVPINCVIVDFQACRCMPLAGDVVSLLYLNQTRSQRTCNFGEMQRYYYDTLNDELTRHDLAIDNLITWKVFEETCEAYKLWGLVQCLILFQLALLEQKHADEVVKKLDYDRLLNVTRDEFVVDMLKNDSIYKQRIVESIEEFIESYIL